MTHLPSDPALEYVYLSLQFVAIRCYWDRFGEIYLALEKLDMCASTCSFIKFSFLLLDPSPLSLKR